MYVNVLITDICMEKINQAIHGLFEAAMQALTVMTTSLDIHVLLYSLVAASH